MSEDQVCKTCVCGDGRHADWCWRKPRQRAPAEKPLSDAEDGFCNICHAHTQVAFGDDPTDICHSCVYGELDRLKAHNRKLAELLTEAMGWVADMAPLNRMRAAIEENDDEQ